ncbi:MAG: prepilin peptidase [Patescibacteria group bacterium]
MTTIVAILIFILGAAKGSFLSVLIHRLEHKQKGIFGGRSMCPACKKPIKWQHLVPIFSWLFLRGKCGYCGKKISSHYLFLEILTGAVYALTFLQFNFIEGVPLQYLFFYLVVFTFLVAIFFYDLLHKQIPDQLSLPAAAIAIIGNLLLGTIAWDNMLIGAAVVGGFFLLQFILSKGKWIGGGDIRLGILAGLLLGWKFGLIALVISYLLGGIYSIYLLSTGKATRKTAVPYGPFLVTAMVIMALYGNQIVEWYSNTFLI